MHDGIRSILGDVKNNVERVSNFDRYVVLARNRIIVIVVMVRDGHNRANLPFGIVLLAESHQI